MAIMGIQQSRLRNVRNALVMVAHVIQLQENVSLASMFIGFE